MLAWMPKAAGFLQARRSSYCRTNSSTVSQQNLFRAQRQRLAQRI